LINSLITRLGIAGKRNKNLFAEVQKIKY